MPHNNYICYRTLEINNSILIALLIVVIAIITGATILIASRLRIIKQNNDIKKSELKLQELNQSKDKFFSIVAHDLKNPFNGIMGMSEYLFTEYENIDIKEKKEIINDINIASKNAFNLLQNLLEWTRAQSGLIKNMPVKIEPKNIVSLSLETVSNLAKSKEIEIKEQYYTNDCAYADENLTSTIIRNLVTNAIKYSKRNSIIEIIVNTHLNELFFCIKDYGIGLKSDEIDQLFRIDVNIQKRGTENETGTGLGLKLCKEFVHYCGGRIWVISEHGRGSAFYFTLPNYNTQSTEK
jgi:signal transduction histidine kinase